MFTKNCSTGIYLASLDSVGNATTGLVFIEADSRGHFYRSDFNAWFKRSERPSGQIDKVKFARLN